MTDDLRRCSWAGREPRMIEYHDREWGVPLRDDRRLFELLILEGAQAGLSWATVLAKRDRYREVFDGFDPEKVARYDERRVARLLCDPGIIRNRLKIRAAVGNARAFLDLRDAENGFSSWIWSFVGGEPKIHHRRRQSDVPASTPESGAMSRELRRRGFRFVGPTICYAFMQSAGMVNDHLVECFRHAELS